MTTMPAQASLRQRREATVREHIDAESRYDPDGVVATFSHYCWESQWHTQVDIYSGLNYNGVAEKD